MQDNILVHGGTGALNSLPDYHHTGVLLQVRQTQRPGLRKGLAGLIINILILKCLTAIRQNGNFTISCPYGIFIVSFGESRRPYNSHYYHIIFKTSGRCHPTAQAYS